MSSTFIDIFYTFGHLVKI